MAPYQPDHPMGMVPTLEVPTTWTKDRLCLCPLKPPEYNQTKTMPVGSRDSRAMPVSKRPVPVANSTVCLRNCPTTLQKDWSQCNWARNIPKPPNQRTGPYLGPAPQTPIPKSPCSARKAPPPSSLSLWILGSLKQPPLHDWGPLGPSRERTGLLSGPLSVTMYSTRRLPVIHNAAIDCLAPGTAWGCVCPKPPEGSLGYATCAQEAISTMRRKKMLRSALKDRRCPSVTESETRR